MLRVENLCVKTSNREIIKGISFEIERGRTLALVGESGSGKSVTARAVMGLNASNLIVSGSVSLGGKKFESEKEMEAVRGKEMGFIFQDALNALNPQIKVGKQIREVLDIHGIGKPQHRKDMVLSLMDRLKLQPSESVYEAYPHMLSGGMAQRALIASVIVASPKLIIADEPTTALDVLTQKGILELLKEISSGGMTMLFITHNLLVAKYIADYIAVMYEGRIVEYGPACKILEKPEHPYTKTLKDSIPEIGKTLIKPKIGKNRRVCACDFYERCDFRDDSCIESVKVHETDRGYVRCNRSLK